MDEQAKSLIAQIERNGFDGSWMLEPGAVLTEQQQALVNLAKTLTPDPCVIPINRRA